MIERANGSVVHSTLPLPPLPPDGPEQDAWYLARCDNREALALALAALDLAAGDTFVTCGMALAEQADGSDGLCCLVTSGTVLPDGSVHAIDERALPLENLGDAAQLQAPLDTLNNDTN